MAGKHSIRVVVYYLLRVELVTWPFWLVGHLLSLQQAMHKVAFALTCHPISRCSGLCNAIVDPRIASPIL
jgi:hypothetical protein